MEYKCLVLEYWLYIYTYTFNHSGVGVDSMDTDGQEESVTGVKPYFQHG